jgi:hypothetical protein
VVERVLFDKNRLMLLMLTRSLDFSWDTTISLLFLCASGRRISALSLNVYKNDFERLDAVTSRDVLRSYASRRRPLRLLAETERRPALPMR